MSYVLLQGTATAIPLAAETVQCVVTSPPYWGLRQYAGEQREVWGGDVEHVHEWDDHKRTGGGKQNEAGSRWQHTDGGVSGHASVTTQFCECGAWYGALGLEPTPWLYVEHIVEVCREVWRVLGADGVFWLNLGDTFYTGAGSVGERPSGGAQGDRWGGNRGVRTPGPAGKAARTVSGIGPMTQTNRASQPGLRPKSRLLIPHRVAIALADDGWIVRMDNVWSKPNPMPDSTDDRTTPSHEYVFQLVKSERYYYDKAAILEPLAEASLKRINQETFDQQTGGPKDYANGTNPARSARRALEHFRAGQLDERSDGRLTGAPGQAHHMSEAGWADGAGRNARSVWTIATQPYPGAHFATFPEAIPERCILASSRPGDVVLDPFNGSGTTGAVALRLGRSYVGLDRSAEYLGEQALHRIDPLAGAAADVRTTGLGQGVLGL